MDNAKSIIDIEVNDDQFKEFHKLFLEYKKALGDTPKQWKSADTAANDMTAALGAHVALMDKNLQAQRELIKEEHDLAKQRDQYNKLQASADKRANDALEKRQKLIKTMGDGLSSIIGKTASIGLNFAKWGIGTGLALAGGTFWGMDRLGQTATADRSTSRVMGVTPGELRSWRTNFSPYGDPNALLGVASNAYSDVGTRALLERAGVGASAIRSNNTSQIAEQTLRGLTDFYRHYQGPNAQQAWASRGFDRIMSFNDIRGFAALSHGEQEQFYRHLHTDSGTLGNSDRTLRQWQDFSVQLARAGQQLKTVFLDGLSKLTAPMSQLSAALINVVNSFMKSGAFKDVIDMMTKGLNEIAKSFNDGSFSADLKTIEKGVSTLAKIMGWVVAPDTSNQSGSGMRSGAVKGGAIGAGIGSIAGPGGTVVGGTIGAAIGGVYGGFAGIHGERISRNGLYGLARLSGNSADMADYLTAIAMTESSGLVGAQSKVGAQGLFQLMPSVQKQYGITDPFSIRQSLRGGSALISYLMGHYHGNMQEATAAYNAGSSRVDSAIKRYGERNWLQHLPQETQQYVGRVASNVQSSNLRIQISNTTGGAATVTARQAGGL